MNIEELIDRNFDDRFDSVPGLTWHPWVGARYPTRGAGKKLLIVGESHYVPASRKDLEVALQEYNQQKSSTRDVIFESPVMRDFPNKTLSNITKLLFADAEVVPSVFWGNVAYYNFVQRPMNYQVVERPKPEDFAHGWEVFEAVVEILEPAYCVFIGVEAANSFCGHLQRRDPSLQGVSKVEKVGRTWGRRAAISVAGKSIELYFVQHAGKYFSWERWNQYLNKHHPTFMAGLSRDE